MVAPEGKRTTVRPRRAILRSLASVPRSNPAASSSSWFSTSPVAQSSCSAPIPFFQRIESPLLICPPQERQVPLYFAIIVCASEVVPTRPRYSAPPTLQGLQWSTRKQFAGHAGERVVYGQRRDWSILRAPGSEMGRAHITKARRSNHDRREHAKRCMRVGE